MTFDGVQVKGVPVWDHMRSHEASVAEISSYHNQHEHQFVYHHTALHVGSLSEFSHAHAGIAAGTPGGGANKTTSFYPYGLRLRPETPLFSCIHAQNKLLVPMVFETQWNFSYEVLVSSMPDPRALVAGWIHTTASVQQKARRNFSQPFQVFS